MSSKSPASINVLVTFISSLLGFKLPDIWLWATIIESELESIAPLNISLKWIGDRSKTPI